jgi:hypothetical protein
MIGVREASSVADLTPVPWSRQGARSGPSPVVDHAGGDGHRRSHTGGHMGAPHSSGVAPNSPSAGPEPDDGVPHGRERPPLPVMAVVLGECPEPESPRPQSRCPDLHETFHAGRATLEDIEQVFLEALRQHPESRFLQTLYAQHVQLKALRPKDPIEECG